MTEETKRGNDLLKMIDPEALSVEVKPVTAHLKELRITHWELRLFFNIRTQTVTQLSTTELEQVAAVIAEAVANKDNPDYISATLNFESEDKPKESHAI